MECTANVIATCQDIRLERFMGREHHAGCAKAALRRSVVDKCLLQTRETISVTKTRHGGDAPTICLCGEYETTAHRRAVDQNGAGSADALTTSIFHVEDCAKVSQPAQK